MPPAPGAAEALPELATAEALPELAAAAVKTRTLLARFLGSLESAVGNGGEESHLDRFSASNAAPRESAPRTRRARGAPTCAENPSGSRARSFHDARTLCFHLAHTVLRRQTLRRAHFPIGARQQASP